MKGICHAEDKSTGFWLRRVLKPRLIAVFVIVLTLGIIITGFLFNWLI